MPNALFRVFCIVLVLILSACNEAKKDCLCTAIEISSLRLEENKIEIVLVIFSVTVRISFRERIFLKPH